MVKYKIARTIIFISAILLLFASFVYAKRQAITENDLDQVTAESGITIGLNINAQMSATSLGLYQTSAEAEGISIASLSILDAEDPGPFSVSTNVTMDVGTSGTRTWLNISGLDFPNQTGNLPLSSYGAPNAVSIMTSGLQAKDSATTTYTLADSLQLYGMYVGKSVNLWTSGTDYVNFTPNPTFVRISNHGGSGIDLIAEAGLLLRLLIIRPNTADTHRYWVDGLILSRHTEATPDTTADPAGWPDLSGNARIGGNIPTYSYDTSDNSIGRVGYKSTVATIDVGRSATENVIVLNMPMAFSLNWKHMYLDQGSGEDIDTGASLLQNVSVYKAQLTIRDKF